MNASDDTESIVLGGGCFWCVEAIYSEVKGVKQAESGYSGGTVSRPSYEQVCTGKTGHAEVVRVTFDPQAISLKEILRIFFTTHDPTTLNRQGADRGTQYRSVVFFEDPGQEEVIEEALGEISDQEIWADPIVTEIARLADFFPAEEYHRDYFKRNPDAAYCRVVIEPKVAKFRAKYAARLR